MMNQEANLLSELNAALPDLNKSEIKVANAILEDPEAATRSSIAVLASAANVSEPSVNRFCKKFGATGFPDFKLRLARSLVSGVRYISRAVEMGDVAASQACLISRPGRRKLKSGPKRKCKFISQLVIYMRALKTE